MPLLAQLWVVALVAVFVQYPNFAQASLSVSGKVPWSEQLADSTTVAEAEPAQTSLRGVRLTPILPATLDAGVCLPHARHWPGP